jgi:enediyne biosynthesis protein E4
MIDYTATKPFRTAAGHGRAGATLGGWALGWLVCGLLSSCHRGPGDAGTGSADVRQPTRQQTQPNAPQPNATQMAFQVREIPALAAVQYASGREAGMNAILEIVGGGVASFDYDLDGFADWCFAGGGTLQPASQTVRGSPSSLLRVTENWGVVDVTTASRFDSSALFAHGMIGADYNHDGFPDLLVYGYGGLMLWTNQGDGTFVSGAHEPLLAQPHWPTAVTWVDLDGDGLLDLYAGSYVRWDFETHRVCDNRHGQADVCSPNAFAGSEERFLRSRGDGSFEDYGHRVTGKKPAKALGVVYAQLEAGGRGCLYVANDLLPNSLYVADAQGGWRETAHLAGVAVDASGTANGSMGIAPLDFNGDGLLDLLVTNFEHEELALYQNEGGLLFAHRSRDAGLNLIRSGVVGFGVVAGDFDGDGDEDVLLTSGHVHYHPLAGSIEQPPLLLENLDGQRFVQRSGACEYLNGKHIGRGLITGDWDRDGDLDVLVTHLGQPPVLLENVANTGGSWLALRLHGRSSPRVPYTAEARVRIPALSVATETESTRSVATEAEATAAGAGQSGAAAERGPWLVRQLVGGGSYLAQSQEELHFRWPGGAAVDLTVTWPSGQVTQLRGVQPNQRLELVE